MSKNGGNTTRAIFSVDKGKNWVKTKLTPNYNLEFWPIKYAEGVWIAAGYGCTSCPADKDDRVVRINDNEIETNDWEIIIDKVNLPPK